MANILASSKNLLTSSINKFAIDIFLKAKYSLSFSNLYTMPNPPLPIISIILYSLEFIVKVVLLLIHIFIY